MEHIFLEMNEKDKLGQDSERKRQKETARFVVKMCRALLFLIAGERQGSLN